MAGECQEQFAVARILDPAPLVSSQCVAMRFPSGDQAARVIQLSSGSMSSFSRTFPRGRVPDEGIAGAQAPLHGTVGEALYNIGRGTLQECQVSPHYNHEGSMEFRR